MNKYEQRRLDLLTLIEKMGRGGRVRVATAINKSPDYISRMLYPKDKPGHKGIGEDSVDMLDKAFPGWQTQNAASVNSNPTTIVTTARELEPASLSYSSWPFKTIKPIEWHSLAPEKKEMLELQIRALLVDDTANAKAA